MPQAARTSHAIGLLYLIGIAQGLVMISFPAASAILVSPAGFALSSTQYGAMFLPQVVLAILASAFAPALSLRLGMAGVLRLGLAANLGSMALLAASTLLMGSPAAFLVLLLATALLGLGFGATALTLNALVQRFSSPERQDVTVLTLNALIGLGTALAPLLIALFNRIAAWWALPVLMTLCLGALLLATLRAHLATTADTAPGRWSFPARFWVYAAAVLLYGIVESLGGNWTTLYLTGQRGISAENASFALTAFWMMLTIGRIAFAMLAGRLSVTLVLVGLPVVLALAFQLAVRADTTGLGIAAFALVGLACSAILPLALSFAGREFPQQAATMLGALIAFYQVGYGLAAFGGGPLLDRAGLSHAALFSLGSVAALALGGVALTLVRRRA